MERLAEVGAFDCFDRGRREALWGVLDQTEHPTRLLVGDFEEMPSFRPLSAAEEVTWDYLASDQSPRGHVMEQFRPLLEKQGLPDSSAVTRMKHGRKVSLAGCAICRQMPGTAAGVLFMTLEDESGFANLVVWEKVFKEYRTLILTSWLLGVTGRLQVAEGVVHIIAESFWKPDFSAEERRTAPSSHDFR
jgi:error-prone DNA polymerase